MAYCSVVVVFFVWFNKEMLWPLCYLENFIPQITKQKTVGKSVTDSGYAYVTH